MKTIRNLFYILTLSFLISCGGGSGESKSSKGVVVVHAISDGAPVDLTDGIGTFIKTYRYSSDLAFVQTEDSIYRVFSTGSRGVALFSNLIDQDVSKRNIVVLAGSVEDGIKTEVFTDNQELDFIDGQAGLKVINATDGFINVSFAGIANFSGIPSIEETIYKNINAVSGRVTVTSDSGVVDSKVILVEPKKKNILIVSGDKNEMLNIRLLN